MIISCPSCQTRFKVDDALFARNGRKVRCSKCGHVWPAAPDEPPAQTPAERTGEPVAQKAGETGSSEDQEARVDGLTDEQRAKLEVARQEKPRSRFWIKVLLIFIIVAGLLLLAQKMMPIPDPASTGPAAEQPAADVGQMGAKPDKGGHIVGGEPPAKPAK